MTVPTDDDGPLVPVAAIYALAGALRAVCDGHDNDEKLPAATVEYAFARFGIPLPGPARPATGGDRVRAAATGLAVVIGRYSDGSSLSAACYGPYDAERAEAVAGLLDAGSWYGMQWLVIPVGVLPGGET